MFFSILLYEANIYVFIKIKINKYSLNYIFNAPPKPHSFVNNPLECGVPFEHLMDLIHSDINKLATNISQLNSFLSLTGINLDLFPDGSTCSSYDDIREPELGMNHSVHVRHVTILKRQQTIIEYFKTANALGFGGGEGQIKNYQVMELTGTFNKFHSITERLNYKR